MDRKTFGPLWSHDLGVRLRGLALAREKGWLLAWDEKQGLYLFNRTGAPQAQVRTPAPLTAACCADDGSASVAVGSHGEIWWLAPDLAVRWERSVGQQPVSAALDSFGQYLAVADVRGNLHFFDRHGRSLCQVQSPRPLHSLAFVPAAPYLLGSADYGLVTCFDLMGRCVWLDGLVAHVGSLAVSGEGDQVMLACFTEGLQRYSLMGKNQGRLQTPEACRLAALSFDGHHILAAGLSKRLLLLNRKGQILGDHLLEKPAVAVTLGALADSATVALAHGRIVCLEVRQTPSP